MVRRDLLKGPFQMANFHAPRAKWLFDIFEGIVDSCARGCQVGDIETENGLRLAIWLGAHVHADTAESARV